MSRVALLILLSLSRMCSVVNADTFLHSVIEKAKLDSHVACSTIISNHRTDNLDNNAGSTLLTLNAELETVLQSMQICQINIFVIHDPNELKPFFNLAMSAMVKMSHYYVIILENSTASINDIFNITFIKRAHDLILLHKMEGSEKRYNVITSKLTGDSPLEITNMYEKDRFVFPNLSFFPRKLQDFEGQRVTGATFKFEPYVTERIMPDGSIEFGGFETSIVRAIAQSLNINLVLKHPKVVDDWWVLHEEVLGKGFNYNAVNNITKEQDGESDFSYNNVFANDYGDETEKIYPDNYCIASRVPEPSSTNWTWLYLPLQYQVWLCFLAITLIGATFLFAYTYINKDFSFGKGFAFYFAIIVDQAEYMTQSLQEDGIRIFFGVLGLMMFILGSAYKCTLTSFMTSQEAPKVWATLKEAGEAKMIIANFDSYMVNLMLTSPDVNIRNLEHKIVQVPSDKGLQMMSKGQAVSLNSEIYLEHSIMELDQKIANGRTNFYIVKECWRTFYITLILKRNSQYTIPFNRKIVQLKASGLIEKWMRDALGRRQHSPESDFQQMSLVHIKGPFYVFAIALALSIASFVLENLMVFVHKMNKDMLANYEMGTMA